MHLSRRLVLGAVPLLLVGSAAGAATTFHYYGGNVVSNARVVQVSWGSNVPSSTQTGLQAFYPAVLNSPYLDWLSEYSTVGLNGFGDGLPGSNQRIGRGTYGGAFTITPTLSGTTLAYADIEAELTAQIAAGHLPAPTFDWQGIADTVYVVDFPPGVTIDLNGDQSCQTFCAVFGTLTVGGKHVGTALVPDLTTGPCATGCGNGATNFDVVTQVHSHELLEVITNAEYALSSGSARPAAWADTSIGTIANPCNANGAQVAGYWVEKGWSTRANACIAQTSSPLAVCDGSTTLCRQCSAADNGQAGGCTANRPACETDGTNPAFGECVACATSANCSGTTPVCDKADAGNDTCRACVLDADCTGNAAGPHCLSTGACGAAPGGGGGSGGGCTSAGQPEPLLWLVPALLAAAGLLRRRRLRS